MHEFDLECSINTVVYHEFFLLSGWVNSCADVLSSVGGASICFNSGCNIFSFKIFAPVNPKLLNKVLWILF